MAQQTYRSSTQRRPRRRKPRQVEMAFRTWGGKRKGSGRKKLRPGAVSHGPRAPLAARHPVHISYGVAGDLPSLRRPDILQAIEDCLREITERAKKCSPVGRVGGAKKKGADFRVVHYSIQREHLHLIVEAHNRRALTKGLKGLAVRIAKRINKLLGRVGPVFLDRYFERILRSPKQTRNVLLYVLNNARRHAAQAGMVCARGWVDPCSSAPYFDGWDAPVAVPAGPGPPVSTPHTWLLARGWRRLGRLPVDGVPG